MTIERVTLQAQFRDETMVVLRDYGSQASRWEMTSAAWMRAWYIDNPDSAAVDYDAKDKTYSGLPVTIVPGATIEWKLLGDKSSVQIRDGRLWVDEWDAVGIPTWNALEC